MIGIYEKENPNTIWDDGAPWEAKHELFEPHLVRIEQWLNVAIERMPILANVGVKRIFHGAIPDTPDGNMLLGPAPGLKNYWCCCGTQMGIGWGPGAGKYLAQWMVQGAAEISMREFDPRRYGAFADREYVLEKSKEDYVLHRVVPFPGLNRLVGRPVKALLRSLDVLHDFYVPEFRAKMDIIPGMITYFWLTPTRTRKFDILCFELCGVGHYAMRGSVVVEEKSAFEAWLKEQPTFAQSLAAARTNAEGSVDLVLNKAPTESDKRGSTQEILTR